VTLPFPRFEKIKIIIQLKLQLMHIIWLFNPLWNSFGLTKFVRYNWVV
jgi:hypothetical protein